MILAAQAADRRVDFRNPDPTIDHDLQLFHLRALDQPHIFELFAHTDCTYCKFDIYQD